jgi:hypothetical protein
MMVRPKVSRSTTAATEARGGEHLCLPGEGPVLGDRLLILGDLGVVSRRYRRVTDQIPSR